MPISQSLSQALARLDAADSPSAYAGACAALLERLALECTDAGEECVAAWQDNAAGRPWRELNRRLLRMSDTMLDCASAAPGHVAGHPSVRP